MILVTPPQPRGASARTGQRVAAPSRSVSWRALARSRLWSRIIESERGHPTCRPSATAPSSTATSYTSRTCRSVAKHKSACANTEGLCAIAKGESRADASRAVVRALRGSDSSLSGVQIGCIARRLLLSLPQHTRLRIAPSASHMARGGGFALEY